VGHRNRKSHGKGGESRGILKAQNKTVYIFTGIDQNQLNVDFQIGTKLS